MASASPDPEALKRDGNAAFERKDYAAAIDLYSSAIDAAITSGGKAVADKAHFLAVLYGNRSAARFALKDHPGAEADARDSVRNDAAWAKAHMRLGTVLSAVGRHREAVACFEAALKIEPGNTSAFRELRDALAAAGKADSTGPVKDALQMLEILSRVRDPRVRLATLAHMWNGTAGAPSGGARWAIFSEFLRLVAGPAAVTPRDGTAATGSGGKDAGAGSASGGAGADAGASEGQAESGARPSSADDGPSHGQAHSQSSSSSSSSSRAQPQSLADPRPDLPLDIVHISQFKPEAFAFDLPLDIYKDVKVPSPWLAWYSTMSATSGGGNGAAASSADGSTPAATAAPGGPAEAAGAGSGPTATVGTGTDGTLLDFWRAVWHGCSAVERGLIIDDFRAFYAPKDGPLGPVASGAGVGVGHGGIGQAGNGAGAWPRPSQDKTSTGAGRANGVTAAAGATTGSMRLASAAAVAAAAHAPLPAVGAGATPNTVTAAPAAVVTQPSAAAAAAGGATAAGATAGSPKGSSGSSGNGTGRTGPRTKITVAPGTGSGTGPVAAGGGPAALGAAATGAGGQSKL